MSSTRIGDAHGDVMLPSVGELHSFFCQPRRTDTTLDARHVQLPRAHPIDPSWWPTEPSWPSQLTLELHHLPPDAAVALLVLSSLALLGPLLFLPTVHLLESDTSRRDVQNFHRRREVPNELLPWDSLPCTPQVWVVCYRNPDNTQLLSPCSCRNLWKHHWTIPS